MSGAKGEPGNWNGAEPVRNLKAREARLREVLEGVREALASVYCDMYDSSPLGEEVCDEVAEALSRLNELLEPKQPGGSGR